MQLMMMIMLEVLTIIDFGDILSVSRSSLEQPSVHRRGANRIEKSKVLKKRK